MNDKLIGMVSIIAWSHNRWKGFDIEGFSKRAEYGFEYVKQTGMAHDWWNFYEGFDERYYIGHIETGSKKPKFRRGLIIFISRNVNDGKYYFVGFYGKGKYSENGFKTGKKVVELLPENYILWAKEAINKKEIEEKYAKYVKEALSGDAEYVSRYRGDKEFSAVFDEEGFIEIQANDIGFKKFGNVTFSYIGNIEKVKPEKACLLLLKAKQKHEELLKKDIPEDRRKDISDIIRKIDLVLKTYFEGGTLCMKFELQPSTPSIQSLRSYYKSKGYLFPSSLISQFYAAIKTKGFVILSGLSGTGKTKLAIEIAELLRRADVIKYPQLLAAWGSEDSEEELRKALEEIYKTIENNGYSTLIWGPAGKASQVKTPFILWVTYNNKVRAGFLIEKIYTKDEVESDPNLKERLQKGYEWFKEVYGYARSKDAFSEDLKRLEGKHKSVVIFEASYAYIRELELSKFEKVGGGYPAIPKSGYTEVTLKDVPEDIPDKFITKNSLFLSVRPDWRDSKPLLGYYNPLDRKYYETELLKFILRAKEDYERNRKDAMPYVIILDEMNLAHVEYYFADFLSVLESGRDGSGFTREGIKLHDMDEVAKKQGVPKEIKLPPNLYILGTVNVDETTYMFSPKVLDRAFTIEFRDVDLQSYPPENAESFDWDELQKAVLDDLRRGGEFTAYAKDEINQAVNELKGTPYWRFLNELNKSLEPYDLHFGYRVVDEIALFYKNAKESQERRVIEFEDDDEIFDLAILTKIFPKFHGNRRRLEGPLKLVLKYCLESDSSLKIDELDGEKVKDLLENWQSKQSEFKFKHTAKKVLKMLRQLYEVGFSSFF